DEAWPIAIAAGALLLGVIALGFVVYASPALFAEVLIDAAVVGAVYRRTRGHTRSHWLRGALRRTLAPAAALCLLLPLAGLALEHAAPGAHTLRAVIAARESR